MGRRILVTTFTFVLVLFVLICVYAFVKKKYAELKLKKPEQIHISFAEKTNDIVVMWSTKEDTNGTLLIYGACDGSSKGSLQAMVNGTRTLFVDDGPLQSRQTIHRVVLKDLKFNTTYKYMVGSAHILSETLSFRTPPKGARWPVNALVFGGLGVDNGVTLPYMIKDLLKNQYNLIIHAGDIGYYLCKDNGKIGDAFFNGIQPMAARVPYLVCPGNLETYYDYSHYKARFSMPSRDKYQNMFYSFNLGPVHFVSVNTEPYFDDSTYYPDSEKDFIAKQISTQYTWLRSDLEEANKSENRDQRPWIILYGHRPMLCSNNLAFDRCMEQFYEFPHRVGNSSYGGFGLEVLLKDYGVDLSIWAHQNSYERLWPVYNKTVYNGSLEWPYVNPGAPVHVTSGAAGNDELPDDFVDDPPAWSAFRNNDYGYSRLSVRNETHLFFEQLAVKNDTLEQVDSFWLVREKHGPYKI